MRGVDQSDTEAAAWYQKAADQGYAQAQYNLGVFYNDQRTAGALHQVIIASLDLSTLSCFKHKNIALICNINRALREKQHFACTHHFALQTALEERQKAGHDQRQGVANRRQKAQAFALGSC